MSGDSIEDVDYVERAENLGIEALDQKQDNGPDKVMDILESRRVYEDYPGQRNMAYEMVDYIRSKDGFTASYREITVEFGWRPEKAERISRELEENGLAEAEEELVYLSPEFPEKENPPFRDYSNI